MKGGEPQMTRDERLAELNKIRMEMFHLFAKVARLPEHEDVIMEYVELCDDHQRVLAELAGE